MAPSASSAFDTGLGLGLAYGEPEAQLNSPISHWSILRARRAHGPLNGGAASLLGSAYLPPREHSRSRHRIGFGAAALAMRGVYTGSSGRGGAERCAREERGE